CDVLGVDGRQIAWIDNDQARQPGCHPTELVALIETGEGPSLATSHPAALFLPAGGHHQDHLAVHQAALAATRPGPRDGRPLPRLIAGYEGPDDRWITAGQPRPLLVDISDHLDTKTKALDCYISQLRADPHPRSPIKITAADVAA